MTKRMGLHGREEVEGRLCSRPGCPNAGEFRAPGSRRASFDGPGQWSWLCLDHVREFNAAYNYFNGMSSDEIVAAQTPYGGWERETRAFAQAASPLPRWADFADPLDAIGAGIRARARARPNGQAAPPDPVSPSERKALAVLGLDAGADGRTVRRAYLTLVRRYHPDSNGGDRTHEKALQAVIDAYTALKGRPRYA